MLRQDIGSYLGLTLETVSRLLSRMQRDGVLQVQGKSISLLDFPALVATRGNHTPNTSTRRSIPLSIAKETWLTRTEPGR